MSVYILTVGTEQKLRTLTTTMQVTMDGHLLEEDPSKCEFLLGCKIESGLKWTQHVEYLLGNLRKRLVALAHLKYIAPLSVRLAPVWRMHSDQSKRYSNFAEQGS